MIIGIGSDIVNIDRIERMLSVYGKRFLNRVFTEHEQQRGNISNPSLAAAVFAKRFAAKEAVAKALGLGFACGISFKDIGVRNLRNGRPIIELTGGAQSYLSALIPEGLDPKIELSLSDDPPMAQAFVIISAVKKKFCENIL